MVIEDVLSQTAEAIKNKKVGNSINEENSYVYMDSKNIDIGINLSNYRNGNVLLSNFIKPSSILTSEEKKELGKYCAIFIKKCLDKREKEAKSLLVQELAKGL